jgi:NitT/TauT family transport system ATP-binding protein
VTQNAQSPGFADYESASSGKFDVLTLASVSLVYHPTKGAEIQALNDINLTVRDNEFVVIAGPSGCGKSTLLKLMVGLLSPSKGTVLHEGKAIRGTLENVGMVYQAPLLLPWRNVLQNVMLPVQLRQLDQSGFRESAAQLLATVGLDSFRSALPRQLSGGMQQRVALCRALITDPPLLLMDEPFAALDALTRDEMAQELARLWQHRRKTVVFVTHGIAEAVLLADRVIVMSPRPGTIVEEIKIDLPRPREESRRSGRFSEYVERIRDIIFSFKSR